jgi:hypothetical protein
MDGKPHRFNDDNGRMTDTGFAIVTAIGLALPVAVGCS